MTYFVALDKDGLVSQVLSGQVGEDEHLKVVRPYSDEPAVGEIFYLGPNDIKVIAGTRLNNGYLEPRPVSPEPYESEGDVVIPPCPAGTKITIYDLSGKEKMAEITADVDDFTETITLPDPGLYEIEVEAPLPHVPSRRKVAV